MNANLAIAALRCLRFLGKASPVDLAAVALASGVDVSASTKSAPIHPQTAARINLHIPGLFDEDDLAVLQTAFFSNRY